MSSQPDFIAVESRHSNLSRTLLDRIKSEPFISFALLLSLSVFANLIHTIIFFDGSRSHTKFVAYLGFVALTLIVCMVLLKERKERAALLLIQVLAICAITAEVFWLGFGIRAPSLPWFVFASLLAGLNREFRFAIVTTAYGTSMVLLLLLAPSYLPAIVALTQAPVPLSHAIVGWGAFFPLVLTVAMTNARQNHEEVEAVQSKIKGRDFAISAVSHDLRTPLAGMVTAIKLLKHPKATEEAKARYLRILEDTTESLSMLLNDFLDMSKLNAGAFTLSASEFHLGKVLTQACELFATVAEQKGLSLNWNMRNARNVELYGDATRLNQMLSNLISNAMKFTQHGSISVEMEELAFNSDTVTWKCTVSDTGNGIPLESQAHLFEAFFQANNQANVKAAGTGLGLSLVKQLAQQMGGDVGFSSTPGAGSKFWFTFTMGMSKKP
ncbi:MAG: HAMP domain-containing histidine kinase [Burkholderiales bacterium]|nr:HAMP domain-containing histidine kinase [Burkholderiales bacterium]